MLRDSGLKKSLDGEDGARLLIVAQLLVLAALILGFQFIIRTSGGTLFLAAAVAPGLAILAIVIAAAVLMHRYRKGHTLFTVEIYQPGDIIFREGDAADCAYFIQSGEVEVSRQQDGREAVIATLKDGAYFGEMSLLSTDRRNATVRARSVTFLGLIGKENFLSMLTLVRSTQDDVQKTVRERSMGRAGGGGSSAG